MLRSFVFQLMLPPGEEIRGANDPTQEMNAGKRSAASIRHSSVNTLHFTAHRVAFRSHNAAAPC